MDESYFQTKEFKIKRMRTRIEEEEMETLRKQPLNIVRETSFSPLKINQARRNSLTKRVMQNADITDARVAFTI